MHPIFYGFFFKVQPIKIICVFSLVSLRLSLKITLVNKKARKTVKCSKYSNYQRNTANFYMENKMYFLEMGKFSYKLCEKRDSLIPISHYDQIPYGKGHLWLPRWIRCFFFFCFLPSPLTFSWYVFFLRVELRFSLFLFFLFILSIFYYCRSHLNWFTAHFLSFVEWAI